MFMLKVTLCREVPMTLKKNSVQVSQYLIFRRRRLSRSKCSKVTKVPLIFIKGGIMRGRFFQIKARVKRKKKKERNSEKSFKN